MISSLDPSVMDKNFINNKMEIMSLKRRMQAMLRDNCTETGNAINQNLEKECFSPRVGNALNHPELLDIKLSQTRRLATAGVHRREDPKEKKDTFISVNAFLKSNGDLRGFIP